MTRNDSKKGAVSSRAVDVRDTEGSPPEPITEEIEPVEQKRRSLPFWIELPLLVLIALVVAVVIKTFFVQAFRIPSGSMEDTLLIGGQKLASETEVEAGVPILSKIPVLKRAYTSRTTVKDEQTLLILIKPKILIHSEQEQLSFPSFTQR